MDAARPVQSAGAAAGGVRPARVESERCSIEALLDLLCRGQADMGGSLAEYLEVPAVSEPPFVAETAPRFRDMIRAESVALALAPSVYPIDDRIQPRWFRVLLGNPVHGRQQF